MSDSEQLVKHEGAPPAPPTTTTSGGIALRKALDEATEQRKILGEFIKQHMVEDVDYGVVPGTEKRSLFKPGAEKLVDLYRCVAKFKVQKKIETWDGNGFFYYQFVCRIYSRDTGALLAEGYGSCNSKEGKYRWRDAQRRCPSCAKPTIIKSKEEYGGGWFCFPKKGGCGAKYGVSDPSITEQPLGKVENDDVFTVTNTILKMAKKRALVDAAIALARCSDMFTQDEEDLQDEMQEGTDVPPGEAFERAVKPSEEQQKLATAVNACRSQTDVSALKPAIEKAVQGDVEHWLYKLAARRHEELGQRSRSQSLKQRVTSQAGQGQ